MRKLGYRPNSAARALRSGRFRTIGVIMFTLSSYGNMRTLDAIASAATDAGYAITLIPVPHPTQDEVSVAFSRLGEQAVDGVIIIIEAHLLDESDVALPPGPARRRRRLRRAATATRSSTPTRRTAPGWPTEHLLELGHRTVWHVAGPERSFSAERRRASWESTLRAARRARCRPCSSATGRPSRATSSGSQLGRRPRGARRCSPPTTRWRSACSARCTSAAAPCPPTSASSASTTWRRRRSFWPPLTTVHQYFAEVGRLSVEALMHEIEAGERHGTTLVATELVVRDSTAPPPGA